MTTSCSSSSLTHQKIRVDATRSQYTFSHGLGACWHAIETGPWKNAGSAWGANPQWDNSPAWDALFKHADWLGLHLMRIEVDQLMYEPRRREFTFDSTPMKCLYRILDWCERRGTQVKLTQMWNGVAWNAYPDVDPFHSAPLDLAEFAFGISELAEHLIRKKGYTCLEWLCINNEPGRDLCWWKGYGNESLSIVPGLKAVREALDRRQIALPLIGPDYTGIDWDAALFKGGDYLGAYDLHCYVENYMNMPAGWSQNERLLQTWIQRANAEGKPFIMGEFGSMHYGWGGKHPGPSSFYASLKNAEIILRSLELGVHGLIRWSYVNRGDLDGQWQLVDTWNIETNELLPEFTPHPNSYFIFGLLCRLLRPGSKVLDTDMPDANKMGWQRWIHSKGITDPDGETTLFVLNTTEEATVIHCKIHGLSDTAPVYRYRVDESHRNRNDVRLNPEKIGIAGQWEDTLPGFSLAAYSTKKITHETPIY